MHRSKRSERASLAKALRQHPDIYHKKRQSIVGTFKLIETVGELHARYLTVTKLFLSGNALRTLEWAPKFSVLEKLSIRDNMIASMAELEHLKALKRLKEVALEGNPIAWYPFYRSHVLFVLRETIQVVDGKTVSKEDLESAETDIRFETASLKMMVEDYCSAHCLEFVHRLCQVHAELKRVTIPYPPTLYERFRTRKEMANHSWQISGVEVVDDLQTEPTSCRIERLMELWSYSSKLSPGELLYIRETILKRVAATGVARSQRYLKVEKKTNAKKFEPEKGWEIEAFAKTGADLKQRVVEYLVKCDELKANDLADLKSKPRIGTKQKWLKRAVELEAERALRYDEDQQALITDLQRLVERFKHTPEKPPNNYQHRSGGFRSTQSSKASLRDRRRSVSASSFSDLETSRITQNSERLLRTATPAKLEF